MDLKTKPSGLERSGEVARDMFCYCSSATHSADESELHLMPMLSGAEQSYLLLSYIFKSLFPLLLFVKDSAAPWYQSYQFLLA